MRQFLWGALTMSSVIAALFFLRYWRLTRERLFAFFSVAFAVMALNWVELAIADPGMETRHHAYIIRLVAFVLIIIGIVDKNRHGNPP
jgi:hypothetical protein